jgi:competence protein ComEA
MVEWFVAAVPENPVSRRKLLIAAGAGVGAVALIGSLWSNATSGAGETAVAPPTEGVVAEGALAAGATGTLFVQVVGAVMSPGVYELPPDSRVMDAVALAGGLTAKADPASINLARIVQDGEQLVIGTTGGSPSSRSAQPSAININNATIDDFDELPRIGPTLAERIVAYRDANGPFSAIEELLDVPGIGDLTLAGMRDKITL